MEYTNKDGRPGYIFWLTATNTYFNWGEFSMIRYSGVFDEPGAMSFYAIYAILMNRLLKLNPRTELIIIITQIFTLSFAFYIFLILYFFMFISNEKARSAIVLIIILATFFIIINLLKNTKLYFLYLMTIDRFFNFSESTGLSGNNRIELYKTAFSTFLKFPLFGSGEAYLIGKPFHGANILYSLAVHGIIGFILIFIFPFLILFKAIRLLGKKIMLNITVLKCFIILMIMYLQRPEVFGLFQTTILLLFIYSVDLYMNSKTSDLN
ncbi:MAG: O-antigen ligase family protein [Bacteroidales bacterium]|nr:O-antigen ligase family protein [Bacteroidales bacterium]